MANYIDEVKQYPINKGLNNNINQISTKLYE